MAPLVSGIAGFPTSPPSPKLMSCRLVRLKAIFALILDRRWARSHRPKESLLILFLSILTFFKISVYCLDVKILFLNIFGGEVWN